MDDRWKVAISAVLTEAMFATAAGGNWLRLLVFAAMAVLVTWDFRSEATATNRLHGLI